MMKKLKYKLGGVIVFLFISGSTYALDLVSSFTLDMEEWRFANDVDLEWKSEDGNPDGFLQGVDLSDGRFWYFVSPESWAGDRSSCKRLSFDLKIIFAEPNASGIQIFRPIVKIKGNGQEMVWWNEGGGPPNSFWTEYSLPLKFEVFKVIDFDDPVDDDNDTYEEIDAVTFNSIMSDVEEIWIEGEYVYGPDIGGLDNVRLTCPSIDETFLDHFKCYSVESHTPTVDLIDQFGEQNNVFWKPWLRPKVLCNPVEKQHYDMVSSINHPDEHLVCYRIKPVSANKTVIVRNQFGEQRLQVNKSRFLCVPSRKTIVQEPPTFVDDDVCPPNGDSNLKCTLDHFKCYSVIGAKRKIKVGLRDQFGAENTKVFRPRMLCNPVTKVHDNIVFKAHHPKKHLVCYGIEQKPANKTVIIANQFEKQQLWVNKSLTLCLPSEKEEVQSGEIDDGIPINYDIGEVECPEYEEWSPGDNRCMCFLPYVRVPFSGKCSNPEFINAN